MKLCKLCAIAAIVSSMASCGSSDSGSSALDKSLPSDFASLPDTSKVRVLLDKGVAPDSLAVYMCEVAEGKHGNVRISDYMEVDTYIYEKLGEEGFGIYRMAFDSYAASMPLVSKMKLYTASSLGDLDRMGYELGLEYVNQVLDKHLTIGKVDREVAELRRACDNDEDTFNRFLRGFAAGISTRAPGEVPAEIVEAYGTVDPAKIIPKHDSTGAVIETPLTAV